MKFKVLLISLSMVICFSAVAQETNAPKFGKGLFNLVGKDSTWSMKVGMRFQSLATSSWGVNGGLNNPAASMLIRRSRLKFDSEVLVT